MKMPIDPCRMLGGRRVDTHSKPLQWQEALGNRLLHSRYPRKHIPHKSREIKLMSDLRRYFENVGNRAYKDFEPLIPASLYNPKAKTRYTLLVNGDEFAEFTDAREAKINLLCMRELGRCKTELVAHG